MKKYIFLFIFCCSFSIIGKSQTYQQKLNSFMKMLDTYYVDSLNMDSIVEVGIEKILSGLDPHSVYMNKKELEKANEPLVGNFEGVGIQFNILDDTILVLHTISGGPSKRVGIMDGDRIIYINDEKVAGTGIDNDGVFKRLRGSKGTEVRLKIYRTGESELLEFLVIRDKIPLFALDAHYLAAPGLGYIKLSRFSATATEEVVAAIEELKQKGAKNFILDLCGNSGGYLNQAFALSDQFLDGDKLIVYTEGKSQRRENFNATEEGAFQEGKLVVMIDQGSASASEIVSGAIQDWDRGILVGRRTFGKGLVQKAYNLPDQSAVRLTMARYYTPSGRSIQKSYKGGQDQYRDELGERYESGELYDASKVKILDSTKYYTNSKRVVYGGGGVMPDIYVPMDTNWISKYYGKLIRSGVFNSFTIQYVDKNRKELEANYQSMEQFKSKFSIGKPLLDEFYAFAKLKNVTPENEDFYNSLEMMKTQLKALIARNMWDENAYFYIFNDQNEIYQEALEIMGEKKIFKKNKIKS
jgi:carboxyl-terminal processing protease